MMCESVPKGDGSLMKRPSILSTRRWLKGLIDRSLVLGTVDRPAMHDIVRAFVLSQHNPDDLRQSHQRLVNVFRSCRPMDDCTKAREWNNANDTPVSSYVRHHCAEHVRLSLHTDWTITEPVILEWLSDFPQASQALHSFTVDPMPIKPVQLLLCLQLSG